jgi:cytochrome b involved in lipid metabolism
MGKGSKNWETHSSVDDQQKNSSSSILNENEIGKGQFTWEEIRRHSTKRDRWLVIDDRVYDVTKWLKHPGGQMVLNHYAGQDASVRMKTIQKEKK